MQSRFTNRAGDTTDEIALNPSYFALFGVNEALQTMAHEMCHLWQTHYGSPGRARYHNKQWGDKMQSIGLMPSHNGKPNGKKTGDHMADYIIPGGCFVDAIDSLKSKGFVLNWMDRYAEVPDELHAPVLTNTSSSSIEVEAGSSSAKLDQDNYMEIQNMMPHCEMAIPKTAGRIKYSCGCDINLWAKPGISVRCNSCHSDFLAEC